MSDGLLDDGRPIVVADPGDRRIGRGAWARLFASAAIPDEGATAAAQGRRLACDGAVHAVRVSTGELEARVDDCVVTIAAEPVPPRVWSAVVRFARGNHRLEAGVEGREQAVHLEHLMAIDWDEPLIPRAHEIQRVCSCDEGSGDACAHVAAAVYAVASEIDRDPSLLLRWRGCVEAPAAPLVEEPVPVPADAWHAGPIPAAPPLRPLPVAAVLGRLGEAGVEVGDTDLTVVLRPAYEAFADGSTRPV